MSRFTWPPRSAPPESATPRAPAPSPPRGRPQHAGTSPLRSVERTWLGLTTPPLCERIARAAWTPDPSDAYCPRCGHSVGPHECDDTGCSRCRGKRFPWQRIVRLGPYADLLREAIQEVKFTRWRRLGHELGRLLGGALGEALENAGMPRERSVLVPVPCSLRRRLARGIDHSLVLTRGVAEATGLPICRALTRSHRPTQLSVPAGERAANVAGSIRRRSHPELKNRLIILVDDVTTTRATLMAAGIALKNDRKALSKQHLCEANELWTAVLAVTPHPDEGRRDRAVRPEAG